jgi:hypothetical protein
MGFYINPPDISKEAFLERHGMAISFAHARIHDADNDRERVLCVWVDNGQHTAVGIAYSNAERDRFLAPDRRQRRCFIVPLEKLGPPAGLTPGFVAAYRDQKEFTRTD